MKTIGISEFKDLVKNALKNPSLYTNKSIVLWKADYMQYGIAYRIIEECCIEHDKVSPDDQVWYKYSDMMFNMEEISNIEVYPNKESIDTDMSGAKTRGILFNTGYIMNEELNDWFKFINTHTNEKGHLSNDWVLIACAIHPVLKEEDFSYNCEIYSIQPSFEEWVTWVAKYYHPDVVNLVAAFIKANTHSISYDLWQRCMEVLEGLITMNDPKTLKDISEEKFNLKLKGPIMPIAPDFPFKELWEFIQAH